MILTPYILRSYATYFVCINTGLVLLYSVIEFFEKVSRVHHATLEAIIKFIMLNSIPHFFALFPLSAWLSCCFLLREMAQKEEFTTLSTLGITYKSTILPLVSVGVALFLGGFIGNETIAYAFAKQSSQLNQSVFKKKNRARIYDRWLQLDPETFLHFETLDTSHHNGSGISIISLNNQGSLTTKIKADTFSIDPQAQKLILDNARSRNLNTNAPQKHIPKLIMSCPDFFCALAANDKHQSLSKLVSRIIMHKEGLHYSSVSTQVSELISRIIEPAKSLIFCMLTITLFLFFISTTYIKWLCIALLYPLFICITTITSYMVQNGASALCSLIPYIAAISIASLLYVTLEHH